MDTATARRIATESHKGQRTRFGDTVIGHVERVAAAVPREAQATAMLHDVLECSPALAPRLRDEGFTRVELEALELLTHARGESYEDYVLRIADAAGPAGRLARIVKLADLDDHLAHAALPVDAPPYAWARARLLAGTGRGHPYDPASLSGVPGEPP